MAPETMIMWRPSVIVYRNGWINIHPIWCDPQRRSRSHRDDRLGRLDLTDAGLLRRDRLVLDAAIAGKIPSQR